MENNTGMTNNELTLNELNAVNGGAEREIAPGRVPKHNLLEWFLSLFD